MKKIDERDTMFARMAWNKEGEAYKEYYSRNPQKKELDDVIRNKPNLCSEGTMSYNEVNSKIPGAAFSFLSDISHLVENKPVENKVKINKEEAARRIKGLARLYGAKLVGITELKEEHLYSHRGRQEKHYGKEIKTTHKYAIVFACEMNKDMINRAPMISEIIETSKVYVDAAIIGMILSYFIGELGYSARNHMDANYLVIAPLVARDAGIGEIGRNGLLISKKYGSRIRLGVVTTDLELQCDEVKSFGLQEFCKVCNNCALTCPAKAINREEQGEVDGEKRWQINQELCYDKWRSLGTDCGVCISNCPFSQEFEAIRDIEDYTGKRELVEKVLSEYKKCYPLRPFIKGNPEWLG